MFFMGTTTIMLVTDEGRPDEILLNSCAVLGVRQRRAGASSVIGPVRVAQRAATSAAAGLKKAKSFTRQK